MGILDKAKSFLAYEGRDIDRARFDYHFGELSQDALLSTLELYHNGDGGFGRLEVDIKAPASNPFATEQALMDCIQADIEPDEPLLQRTLSYLEETQTEDGDWRFTPEIYQSELAPWFQGWEWPNLNPACTIAGLLKQLGIGSEQLHGRVENLFQQRAKIEDVTSGDFYSMRPYAYYFLPEWEHPEREKYLEALLNTLIEQHNSGKVEDGWHFFEYVRTPDTYTGRNLPADIIKERLDAMTAEQQSDGGWPSPYSPEWRGHFTVQNLLVLKSFGRI